MNIICAIAKNEDKYLDEWITHHIKLGFDHIYIIDDNESPTILELKSVKDNPKVSVIHLESQSKPLKQLRCYEEFYRKYDFDWCAFIDIDEFIVVERGNIKEYLNNYWVKYADQILLSWKMFKDTSLKYFNGPVMERFTVPSSKYNCKEDVLVKCLLRKTGDITFYNPHMAVIKGSTKDACGNSILPKPEQKPLYKSAYINHYFTKSLEEFIDKVRRGRADTGEIRNYMDYFITNDHSVEKEDLLIKLLAKH